MFLRKDEIEAELCDLCFLLLSVRICKVTGLAGGNLNVYVKLRLGRQHKRKTKIMKQNSNPEFFEWFEFQNWAERERMVITVWNKTGPLSGNDCLGQVVFAFPREPSGHNKVVCPLSTVDPMMPASGSIQLEIVDLGVKSKYDKQQKELKQHQANHDLMRKASGRGGLNGPALAHMRKGENFRLHSKSGKVRDITLFYTTEGGPMGTLMWVKKGKPAIADDVPIKVCFPVMCGSYACVLAFQTITEQILFWQACMSMHHVSDVMVGPACAHAQKSADPDLCVTLKGKNSMYQLCALSSKMLDEWLDGIKYA